MVFDWRHKYGFPRGGGEWGGENTEMSGKLQKSW